MRQSQPFDLVTPNGTILGRIELTDADMFWFEGRFAATPAFEPLAPLFREELEILDRDEMDAWEAAYGRITELGLELRPLDGGTPIREYILHIDGDSARLRYESS